MARQKSSRIMIALCGAVVAVTVAACGGSSDGTSGDTKSNAPTIEYTSDGYYVAQVESQEAAATVCKSMQSELAQQLSDLDAPSGSGQLVLFQYGDGDPAERLGNPLSPYAVADGAVAVVSPTLSICGVTTK